MLVFIPAIGEFVIPSLLGGTGHADDRPRPLGRVLRRHQLAARLGGRGGAMLVVVVIPILLLQKARMPLWRRARCRCDMTAGSWSHRGVDLGFAFLYLPIMSLVVFSFNEAGW
jgi:ABC-type spermidine/putrescine transport system permease subunit I